MARSFSEDAALQRLDTATLPEVAALLFVECFPPDGSSPRTFGSIHKDLNRLYGLKKPRFFPDKSRVDFRTVHECQILWERALLPTRAWDGDSSLPDAHLLRRGAAVRESGDPLGQARAALTAVMEASGIL